MTKTCLLSYVIPLALALAATTGCGSDKKAAPKALDCVELQKRLTTCPSHAKRAAEAIYLSSARTAIARAKGAKKAAEAEASFMRTWKSKVYLDRCESGIKNDEKVIKCMAEDSCEGFTTCMIRRFD